MSSLLDGIDVADSSSSSSSSGGPNPKVIKGAIAGVLFLLAAVVLGMNFGIIPAPWGGDTVTNGQGEEIVYIPPSEAEVKAHTEKLQKEEEDFIRRGGTVGGS